jgi:hypothetical protein
MSKASLLEDDLTAHRLPPQELQERREAARPRSKLIATTNGTFKELAPPPLPTPAPTLAPKVHEYKAPLDPVD